MFCNYILKKNLTIKLTEISYFVFKKNLPGSSKFLNTLSLKAVKLGSFGNYKFGSFHPPPYDERQFFIGRQISKYTPSHISFSEFLYLKKVNCFYKNLFVIIVSAIIIFNTRKPCVFYFDPTARS